MTHPTFGQWLSHYLADKELLQNGFSALIGVSPQHLNDMIHDRRKPSHRTVAKVAKVTGANENVLCVMIVTDLAQITPGAIVSYDRGNGQVFPLFEVEAITPTGEHTPGYFMVGEDLETSILVDLVNHRQNQSGFTLLRDSQGRICVAAGNPWSEYCNQKHGRENGWDWCVRYTLQPLHLITPGPPIKPRQIDLFGGMA